ncbi:MAG: 30S ribosome-binding factor RbfA [Dehalococcoidia bacterium]|nr:30S ribosome-binding factor RbfA [Dehalococcoidia bacterium]
MSIRIEKINELIQQEISDLLLRQINDPRLQAFITVTQVETSADLKNAKVYVSILEQAEARKEALRGLESAKGYIRRELATRLNLRFMPHLTFHFDSSIERGARLLEIMEREKPT